MFYCVIKFAYQKTCVFQILFLSNREKYFNSSISWNNSTMVTQRYDQQNTSKPMELRDFVIFSCIGKACAGAANVYLASKRNTDRALAVRICPLDKSSMQLSSLEHEIQTLRQLKHPNILPYIELFACNNFLCFVSPLYDFGSVTDLIHAHHARFLFGLPEPTVVTVLYDVIKALQYIHSRDFLHRGIRCSHILISSESRVCLSGFRQATSVMCHGKRNKTFHEFSPNFKPNLLWLAPEVLQQNLSGYGTKSDIYSIGISACEMANGFPPFSDMAHMQMLLEKLRGTTPRLLDATTLPDHTATDNHGIFAEQKERRFSNHFHNFTELCLKVNPADRPSANELLQHPFFKHVKKHRQSLRELLYPTKPLTLPQGKLTETQPLLELLSSDAGANSSSSDAYKSLEWSF